MKQLKHFEERFLKHDQQVTLKKKEQRMVAQQHEQAR